MQLPNDKMNAKNMAEVADKKVLTSGMDAINSAIQEAKEFFGKSYEGYEVWEMDESEVIIRAWDSTGDYEFFIVEFSSQF